MEWRPIVSVAVYTVVLVGLALSDTHDLVVWVVVFVAAHVGLGLAVARAWVLAVPVATTLVVLIVDGDNLAEWLTTILLSAIPVVFTALGWALGRGPRWLAWPAAGLCAAGLVGATVAVAVDRFRQGPHVAPNVQRALPTEVSLGNLCPEAESPPELERDVRRRADVLLTELRERPRHLVTYTFYYADGGGTERREITVREVAEDQLADLEAGGGDCAPGLQRRLRALL
jgi:hypothetical protein